MSRQFQTLSGGIFLKVLLFLTFFLPESGICYKHSTVNYFSSGNDTLLAELYQPDSGKLRPALVMIHEGGFTAGDRYCFSQHGKYYTQKGFVVLSVGYRLLQQGGAYPVALKDCIEALRWLKAHGAQYKVDTEKIILFGSSAGAYLATMIAVSDGLPAEVKNGHGMYPRENNQVAGTISSFGAYNWTQCGWQGGGFISSSMLTQTSPIQYVKFIKTPFLILAGERDKLFPHQQTIQFVDSLKAMGKSVSFHIKPGQRHRGICEMRGEIFQWAFPMIEKFLQQVTGTKTY